MYLYNVTINIDPDVENEWVLWMKEEHIPKMLETGRFYDSRFLKLLSEQPEAEGTTYAVQYFSKSLSDIEDYLNNEALEMRQQHADKFGTGVVAFRTVLEEV